MTRKAILIMTDSQRWDMVNCYRQTGLRTPNLDALAAQGTRFARAYTTQPVCPTGARGNLHRALPALGRLLDEQLRHLQHGALP